MKVVIIYNKDLNAIINAFGMQNKEVYSQKVVRKVSQALEAGGHNTDIIDGNMHVIESIQELLPKVREGERMGMVFNMAYGIQGESRYTHIPSMLEMLGIPYVGSSPAGHALALDKVVTKIILQQHQISTPQFWVFSSINENMNDVEYPVIVKPKMESVSFGLKVVYNEKDLRDAVDFIIKEFQQHALVEQFIRGREFAVGLIGNNPVEAFPVLEIDLENDPDAIQVAEDKLYNPKNKICPAYIPKELAEEMQSLSKKAFNALQLRDFARVDIRMDQNNKIYLLEVNSMASLGDSGSYIQAAKVAGYNFNSLVNKMLDVAIVRYFSGSHSIENERLIKQKMPLHVRIRSFLRGRQSNIEQLLMSMVNTNTYVRNVEGVNDLGNLIKKQLSLLGFSYQTYPQIEVGNIMFFSNSDQESYDILLLGNLDNSIPLSRQEYFHETEQKLFGTGIWEHKGGLAVMIAALQALRFSKILKKINIGVLLTSDDSLQGRFARNIVKRVTNNSKYIIGLHGAFLDGGLVTSRSGSGFYNCIMNLMKCDNSANVATTTGVFLRLINQWVELTDAENGLVIAPFNMKMESNITEPYAHGNVCLSVRFHDIDQFISVDSKIKSLLPRKYKKTLHFQLEGGERRPPMIRTQEVEYMWKKVKSIAEKLDIRLREEHRWSSADICFVERGKYVIDGFGPVGIKPTNKSEYILKHSLLERSVLLAMMINELYKK